MKNRVLRNAVFGLILSALGASAALGVVLAPGDPAPALLAKDLNGRTWKAQWSDHELTVVNFWATWCGPCIEEMPALQKLQDRLGEHGLLVVGVLARDAASDSEARAFVDDLDLTYPTIRGEREFLGRWGGIGTLPTTYLVGKDGRVRRRYIGASEPQIEALIYDVEAVLDGRPLGPVVIPDLPGGE